jgi:uncharacterized protein
MAPFDVMDAGRMAVITDPEEANSPCGMRHRGARLVNEHGAVNFNGLHTRTSNLAAAKPFYASVFGWRTLTLDGGEEMWTLPQPLATAVWAGGTLARLVNGTG